MRRPGSRACNRLQGSRGGTSARGPGGRARAHKAGCGAGFMKRQARGLGSRLTLTHPRSGCLGTRNIVSCGGRGRKVLTWAPNSTTLGQSQGQGDPKGSPAPGLSPLLSLLTQPLPLALRRPLHASLPRPSNPAVGLASRSWSCEASGRGKGNGTGKETFHEPSHLLGISIQSPAEKQAQALGALKLLREHQEV